MRDRDFIDTLAWIVAGLGLVSASGCGDSSANDDEIGSASESDTGATTVGESNSETGTGTSTGTTSAGTDTSTSDAGTSDASTSDASTSDASTSATDTGTASDSTGSTSESGTSDSTDSDGSTDTTDTDTGVEELPLWILSIDEPGGDIDRLVRISVAPGEEGLTTVICDDLILPANIPANTNFTSLTFNSNVLYASAQDNAVGDTLMIVDPCTCEASEVGKYGFTLVNGITSNAAQVMFGVSVNSDVIIDIDPMTAMSTLLADLGANWGSTGLSWSDPQLNLLYGLNATTDRLHTFDGTDGTELGSIQLDANFNSVGLELHPGLDTLYGCGVANQGTDLFSIDTDTGVVTNVAPTSLGGNCDNLAAPFGPVECIPQ